MVDLVDLNTMGYVENPNKEFSLVLLADFTSADVKNIKVFVLFSFSALLQSKILGPFTKPSII